MNESSKTYFILLFYFTLKINGKESRQNFTSRAEAEEHRQTSVNFARVFNFTEISNVSEETLVVTGSNLTVFS